MVTLSQDRPSTYTTTNQLIAYCSETFQFCHFLCSHPFVSYSIVLDQKRTRVIIFCSLLILLVLQHNFFFVIPSIDCQFMQTAFIILLTYFHALSSPFLLQFHSQFSLIPVSGHSFGVVLPFRPFLAICQGYYKPCTAVSQMETLLTNASDTPYLIFMVKQF